MQIHRSGLYLCPSLPPTRLSSSLSSLVGDKKRIFVFTTATPIINQGKWTCDQQQQKLIGVLTFEETELERATRLLVLT